MLETAGIVPKPVARPYQAQSEITRRMTPLFRNKTSGGTTIRRALAAMVLIVAVAACSSKKSEDDNFIQGSVEDLYNRGTDLMLAGKYKSAAKFYNEVDRQHPYSTWARRAQLMAAFSYYRAREYNTAVAALNRFIRLHPGYRDIGYAYYLRGLSYFDQINDVKRDQSVAFKALASFSELVKRFPNSKYTRDSRRKVDLVRDHLAGHEMEIGRFYQKKGLHLAAINRFRTVVEKYQTTSQVPEALLRLTESYSALGLKSEARRVAAVLGYNFPASEWYVDGYELVENKKIDRGPAPRDKRTFFQRAWQWLF